jgi:hypothetical protein
MPIGRVLGTAAVCALAMGVVAGASAQSMGGAANEYYQGMANGPGCPTIGYIFRGLSETPVGYVWFQNASGVSKATGTLDIKTGKFQLTLKSLDGEGPTGTVVGERDPTTGQVTATLTGPGCSNLRLAPTRNLFTPADNGRG